MLFRQARVSCLLLCSAEVLPLEFQAYLCLVHVYFVFNCGKSSLQLQARFNKDMTEMLVLALERNALPFASSLLFAKLALTVVQQLNCEVHFTTFV